MAHTQPEPRRNKYFTPILITLLIVAFVAGLVALLLWLMSLEDMPKLFLVYLGFYVVVGIGVIAGVIYCLRQRIHEIKGGEEDEANQY